MSLTASIIGFLNFECGWQRFAKHTAQGLKDAGLEVKEIDMDLSNFRPGESSLESKKEDSDVVIYQMIPVPFIEMYHQHFGVKPSRSVLRIGYWSWETEAIPEEWIQIAVAIGICEIWAPSEYVKDACKATIKALGVQDLSVYKITPPIEMPLPIDKTLKASDFGIDPKKYSFLYILDAQSSPLQRKNPHALLEAFRRMRTKDAQLVVKMWHREPNFQAYDAFLRDAQQSGVVVIPEDMEYNQVMALINACDCYVSPHTAEGLGLTIVEAMSLGKPVIVTGYSGNMDYCNEDNAFLIEFERNQIPFETPPYKAGMVWATPDTQNLASLMTYVMQNRVEARKKAKEGAKKVKDHFDPKKFGDKAKKRLEHLLEELKDEPVRNPSVDEVLDKIMPFNPQQFQANPLQISPLRSTPLAEDIVAHMNHAKQLGSYLAVIFSIDAGRLQCYRKMENYPGMDLRESVRLLISDLSQLDPNLPQALLEILTDPQKMKGYYTPSQMKTPYVSPADYQHQRMKREIENQQKFASRIHFPKKD